MLSERDLDPDAELDRLLCDVAVPRGLLARLAAAASDEDRPDDALARQLCDVPVPAGLHRRICDAAALNGEPTSESAAPADRSDSLDERLREVPIPLGLGYRLRETAAWPHVSRRRMIAVAALILLAFTSYEAAVLNYVRSLLLPGDGPNAPPLDVAANPPPAAPRRFTASRIAPPTPPPIIANFTEPRDAIRQVVARQRALLESGPRRFSSSRPPRADLFQAVAWSGGGRAASGLEIQGAAPVADLPDPLRAWFPKSQGVDAKLGAVERKFLLDYGVFPRVSPRDFPTSVVPPAVTTASLEQARAEIAAGRWPSPEQIRTEEFLAGIDLAYAKPTDAAARLVAAGAIAPWNPTQPAAGSTALPVEQTVRLLQVSVQARELPAAPRRAAHLTIGVDLTTSMQNGGRMEMVRRSLEALVRRLGANDRITLVALSGNNPVLIEDAGRDEAAEILAAVEWLSAAGGGNLPRGALAALATAARRAPPKNVACRVVLISDAFDEALAGDLSLLERYSAVAARQVPIDLIDVSGNDDEPTAWDDLARRSAGQRFSADGAAEIRAALLHSLTGRDQTVAEEVELSIAFNPQTVAAYRLFGHEPTALAGVSTPVRFKLSAGQTTTVLYEVLLRDGKDPLAATAKLSWRSPEDDSPQETRLEVTRGMLNAAFEKSSPALQLTTIVAAAAGRLKNSPWGDNVAPGQVLQWAERLNAAGTVRGLELWRDLLQQMERLSTRRGNTRGTR